MNRQQRRAFRHSAPATWDLMMLEGPPTQRGRPTEGILLMVTADGAVIDAVHVWTGEPLGPLVAKAAVQPATGRPGPLPRRIRCVDPALAARLRADLTRFGVRVDVVEALPSTRRAAEQVRRLAAARPLLEVAVEIPRWAEALGGWGREEPWKRFDQRTLIVFGPGPLADHVAIVGGARGEDVTLHLFRSFGAVVELAMQVAAGEPSRPDGLCLMIEPASTCTPEELASLRARGLVLAGERIARVGRRLGGEVYPLTPADERRLLAAAEFALAAATERIHAPNHGQWSLEADTVLGCVSGGLVGGAGELLVPCEHLLTIAEAAERPEEGRPALFLSMDESEAEDLRDRIDGVSGAVVRRELDGVAVALVRGSEEIGLLTVVPEEKAWALHEAAAAGVLDVAVHAGGIRERTPDPQERVAAFTLPVRSGFASPPAFA